MNAAQPLNALISSIINVKKITSEKLLRYRSALGLALNSSCINSYVEGNPLKVIDFLIDTMDKNKFHPSYSIVLIAAISYAAQFISKSKLKESFEEIVETSSQNKQSRKKLDIFFDHINTDNSDFLPLFNSFLSSGGASILPLPEEVIRFLMNQPQSEKSIAIIVNQDPQLHSNIFWEYFDQNFKDSSTEKILSVLNSVTGNMQLSLPSKDTIDTIIEICQKEFNTKSPFYLIECSLTILRWLTHHESYTPNEILPNYSSNSLNLLVVDIWSEYLLKGDLKLIPHFEYPNSRAYLKLIANATKNSNFSFDLIHVNHWLWDEILIEFGYKERTEPFNHSLYELTNFDFLNCLEITHILPRWFFVHLLRFRCKNTDLSEIVIKIISEIPKTILDSNYNDFLNFIDFHINRPTDAPFLGLCIRKLIILLLPNITELISRILSTIDYFNEQNLYSRLTILNEIFRFNVNIKSYFDVFYSVSECLPYLKLSLSLTEAILTTFEIFSTYIEEESIHKELYNIGLAVIYSAFSNDEPSFISSSINSHIIYTSCQNFYSIVSSDIVTNPLYNLQSSYPLTPFAISLINKVKKNNYINIEILIKILQISPFETFLLIFDLFDNKKYDDKQIKKFCDYAYPVSLHNTSEYFDIMILALKRKPKITNFFDKSDKAFSEIKELPNDTYQIRILLQADKEVTPKLLIFQHDQLAFFLEENTIAPIDPTLLNMLSSSIPKSTFKGERIIRLFLLHHKKDQPKYEKYDSWIKRDFIHDETNNQEEPKDYNYIMPNNFTSIEQEIQNFQICYPISLKPKLSLTIINIVKTYHKKKEFTKLLVYLLSNFDLTNECLLQCDSFWFLKYLILHSIDFKFPNDLVVVKSVELGIRTKYLDESYMKKFDLYPYEIYGMKTNEEEINVKQLNFNINFSVCKLIPSYRNHVMEILHSCLSSTENNAKEYFNIHQKEISKFFLEKDLKNPIILKNETVLICTLCEMFEDQFFATLFCKMILNLKDNLSSNVLFHLAPQLHVLINNAESSVKEEIDKLFKKWNNKFPETKVIIKW